MLKHDDELNSQEIRNKFFVVSIRLAENIFERILFSPLAKFYLKLEYFFPSRNQNLGEIFAIPRKQMTKFHENILFREYCRMLFRTSHQTRRFSMSLNKKKDHFRSLKLLRDSLARTEREILKIPGSKLRIRICWNRTNFFFL